ncbi:MAG: STAS domain-containing protein [Planctomycetota bacterium]
MELHRRDVDEVTIYGLNGSFDSISLPAVSGTLDAAIADGRDRLCLNMRDLSFINSTALGYLVALRKRLTDAGGELVFSHASDFFSATFRTLELHHIFQLFESDDEALRHFRV